LLSSFALNPGMVVFARLGCAFLVLAVDSVEVLIHKVGYPLHFVDGLPSCGERFVTKGSHSYFAHLLLENFQPGSCVDDGFPHFEKSITVEDKTLNVTETVAYTLYSRPSNAVDVSFCILSRCQAPIQALGRSPYFHAAYNCTRSQAQPCQPKAAACLKDQGCKEALACAPQVEQSCSQVLMDVLRDPKEMAKLNCMSGCNGDKVCVAKKCSLEAMECMVGLGNSKCHQVVECIPQYMNKCSHAAYMCLIGAGDPRCQDNLACAVNGASNCVDDFVNTLTDLHLADVMTCSRANCPAPVGLEPHNSTVVPDSYVASIKPTPPQKPEPYRFPSQLSCMKNQCKMSVESLINTYELSSLINCSTPALEACQPDLLKCFGEASCRNATTCWLTDFEKTAVQVWEMLETSKGRELPAQLYECVMGCKQTGKTAHVCMATVCSRHLLGCMAFEPCRNVIEPHMRGQCNADLVRSVSFRRSTMCLGHSMYHCGGNLVEVVRSQEIEEFLRCAGEKCTYAPAQPLII